MKNAKIQDTHYPATSLTHEHILSLILTALRENPRGQEISILDAGCGNSLLIVYLMKNLKAIYPEKSFSFSGYDVCDHSVQQEGFFQQGLKNLYKADPTYPWDQSVLLIEQDQPWPFKNQQFDFIISNQVLEHVIDRNHFFSEIHRCLKPDGVSTHLFPVMECILDGHIFIPYIHRFKNRERLKHFIFALSLMGWGSYWSSPEKKKNGFSLRGLKKWSEFNADYILSSCHYMTLKELKTYARQSNFEIDFNFTREFYSRKVFQLLGFKNNYTYTPSSSIMNWFYLHFFKKINGITVTLKPQT